MPFVYSKLSSNNEYRSYKKGGSDLKEKDQFVLIKGGAGVADKNFLTPKGVVTEVTDEQLKLLEENPMFKMHVENGFIAVEKTKASVEKVADDMEKKDQSAPITPEDYKDESKAPKTNKK